MAVLILTPKNQCPWVRPPPCTVNQHWDTEDAEGELDHSPQVGKPRPHSEFAAELSVWSLPQEAHELPGIIKGTVRSLGLKTPLHTAGG